MATRSTSPTGVTQLNLRALRQGITDHFSIQELSVLCLDLGINFEDLSGTNLSAKVVELIQFGNRHGRLQDIVQYVLDERPKANLDSVIRTESQSTDIRSVDARRLHRRQLRDERKDIYLVHTLRPARPLEPRWFDILIYLIPHHTGKISDVAYAEFFLGRMWGDRIFRAEVQDDFVGISISAYGPVLCTARVQFADGSEVILERYIDFEMADVLSSQSQKRK